MAACLGVILVGPLRCSGLNFLRHGLHDEPPCCGLLCNLERVAPETELWHCDTPRSIAVANTRRAARLLAELFSTAFALENHRHGENDGRSSVPCAACLQSPAGNNRTDSIQQLPHIVPVGAAYAGYS
jgi:hypothetical protein